MLSRLASNLVTTYQSLRAAGFRGHLVALTYYVTDYNDQNTVAGDRGDQPGRRGCDNGVRRTSR